MASDCITQTNTTYCLDDETGEIFQTVICLRSSRLNSDLDETCPPNGCSASERSSFRIPTESREQSTESPTEKCRSRRESSTKILGDRTQNISLYVLILPTLLIFPAWASILCALGEITIHIWTHKRNKMKKDDNITYRSPFNLISSEFCARCRTEKWMQKIGEIQDKRSMRRNFTDPDVIKRIVR